MVEEPQRVSPFGFGPYPKVPSDFPRDPIWVAVDMYEKINQHGRGMMKAIELMDRVVIKLWNQGMEQRLRQWVTGSSIQDFPTRFYVDGITLRKKMGQLPDMQDE